jgi:glycosyltransferase 2 family protein
VTGSARFLTRRAGVVRLILSVLLVAVLGLRIGARPFLVAGQVLSPAPIAAALILGLGTSTAQALRWRSVARAYGVAAGLSPSRAVQEVYRSAFLNTVLPGGLAGDAVRVWRQHAGQTRHAGRTLPAAAGSVVVERMSGTALLLLAAAAAALRVDRRLVVLLLAAAAVAAAVAAPGLARLPPRARVTVLGWSLVAMAALLAQFALAAAVLGTVPGRGDVVVLGVVLLAAGSVPLGLAGFGPREAVAVFAFTATGLTAESGVATSTAFGVLAVVSVLPGAVVLLCPGRPNCDEIAAEATGQVEFHADVRSQVEPSRRNPQRIAEPVRAGEP